MTFKMTLDSQLGSVVNQGHVVAMHAELRAAVPMQIFSKVVTAAAVAVTGDPGEFEKIAHSVSSLWLEALQNPLHCVSTWCSIDARLG